MSLGELVDFGCTFKDQAYNMESRFDNVWYNAPKYGSPIDEPMIFSCVDEFRAFYADVEEIRKDKLENHYIYNDMEPFIQ